MKLDFAGFEKANETLKKYLTPTPLTKNEWLSKKYNCNVYLKLENLQPIGSFKLRGAMNMIANLSASERSQGVLAVSAGNHAQGVAWAAAKYGIEATIIMPVGSPMVKIQNTEALGAKVILKGDSVDDSFEFAKEYLKDHNHFYIHPFNQEDVIFGQGSLGFELKDQIDKIDFLFGSVGGGGLLAGVGNVVKKFYPKVKIIASQSSGADSMIKSLQQGELMEVETVKTFADGIKVKKADFKMYELLEEVIDEAIQISDDAVAIAVLDLMERARVIAEGAGAITLATLDCLHSTNPKRFKGKNIVLILSGGNIDINLVDRIIESGLIKSKRRIKISIILDDRPGQLNLLTSIITETGANILQAVHKRDAIHLQLTQSLVEVDLECRGEKHSNDVIATIGKDFKIL